MDVSCEEIVTWLYTCAYTSNIIIVVHHIIINVSECERGLEFHRVNLVEPLK